MCIQQPQEFLSSISKFKFIITGSRHNINTSSQI